MLDVGWSELVIIGVVALVVVGPKELPALLRTTGQWVGKARRMAAEFQGQLNEAIREAELDDVKKSVEDLRSLSPTRLVTDQLASIGDDIKRVGSATEDELGKIRNDLSLGHASPGEAGSGMSAFMEPTEQPALSVAEAEAMIDAAATPVPEIAPPVFDLTPAPGPALASIPTVAAEPPAPAAETTTAATQSEKKAGEA